MRNLLVANLKMMARDRQTVFWALAFPLIFVVVFGLFDVDDPGSVDIAVIDRADTPLSRSIAEKLSSIEFLHIESRSYSEDEARDEVRDGDLEYLLVLPAGLSESRTAGEAPLSVSLYYDETNIQQNQLVIGVVRQFLNDVNLEAAGAERLVEMSPRPVRANQVEYFDVLLVGLAGMGVMFNSVIVIGVTISGYREQRVLKRLLATPLPVRYYFASEVLARLLLSLVQVGIILAAGVLIFGASIHGNVLWLLLIVAFANITFLNIGFAISGLAATPAAASGLGNVIALPMMFFSGTFFPVSTLPAFLPDLVQVLPLTPTLDAMREVALDGGQIWDVGREMAMLGAWAVISSVAAVKLFRFG